MGLVRLDGGKVSPDERLPRNGRKQPLVIVPTPSKLKRDNGKLIDKLVAYTRMTTYIDCLDDKAMLHAYGKRAVLKGMSALSPGELAKVEFLTLGDKDDNKVLNRLAEKAMDAAGAHEKRERGSILHKLSEYVDRDEPLPATVFTDGKTFDVTDADRRDMEAYCLATRSRGLRLTGCIEEPVVLDDLKIAGTPDRIGEYDGLDPDGNPAGSVIVDLKTGRVDYGALKMAMQLAGYSRSKLYTPETGERRDLPANLNLNWGIILNLPPGSATVDVKWIDLDTGWEALNLAQHVRAMRNRGKKVMRSFDNPAELVTEDGEDDE